MRPHLPVAIAICATAAGADPFCDLVARLPGQETRAVVSLPGSGAQATCQQSVILGGGTQVHCSWAFTYRDVAATAAFEALQSEVARCLGGEAVVTADQGVNHPDFQDRRTFRAGSQEIGVSIKDKAALQQTLVFLALRST